MKYRCHLRKIVASGMYRAECVDLDIAVERAGADEARRELRNAIYGYLLVCLDGVGTNEQVPSFARPSPLWHRFVYRFSVYKWEWTMLDFFGGLAA